MALLITLDRRLIQTDNALKAIRRMYRSFSKDFDVPFLKVPYEARNHQAADPRDKVFALLSRPSAYKPPSWVPRWELGGQSTILGEPEFSHFTTAISKEPKITTSGSSGVMRIGGMLLDHVVRHSELIDIKDLLNPRRVLINKLWESYGNTNFSDTYITGELLIEAFQRTLASDGRIYTDRDDCEYVLKLQPRIPS
jgi:hypothetical protein